jgi:predicted nucleic acid-binding protein
MVYADTDFFLALVKDEDWLKKGAEKVLEEYRGDIETGLPTFVELFFLSEEYGWNRDMAASNILEIAEVDFDESIVFKASEYIEQGLSVLDAFQAARAGGKIISSDKEFDEIEKDRVKLEGFRS